MRLVCAAVLLQLCACQIMSGLDELHVQTNAEKRAADMASPKQAADAAPRDAGPDSRVATSNVGPADRGDLEHQDRDEPEHDQGAQADHDGDAGSDPADRAAEAAPADIPLAPTDAGSGEPAMPSNDAGVMEPAERGQPMSDAGVEPEQPTEQAEPPCIPPPPGGPVCAAAPQCGCDAGENCVVDGDELACVSPGRVEVNQPCDGPEDCALGHQCLSGACLQLCDPSEPECPGDAACLALHTSDGEPIEGAHVCESNCDLALPEQARDGLSACGPGLVCVWSGTGSYCAHSDRASHRHGEQCTGVGDCAPGFVCTEQGTCAKWCMSSDDCPDAFSCSLDSPVEVGAVRFGMCQPDCLGQNEYVCGLSTQCGCAEDRSCDTAVNSDNQVVRECRALGTVPLYGTCTTSTDCGRSAQCVAGECRPTCVTDFECDRFARCEPGFFASAPLIAAGATCHRPCDPADPYRAHGFYGRCQAGEACDVTADGASHCRAAAPRGIAGVSCNLNTECAVGYSCTSEHTCVELCRNNADCQAGTCRAFVTSQFATSQEWGYCATGP